MGFPRGCSIHPDYHVCNVHIPRRARNILEKASTESILRFAPLSFKANTSIYEKRDTVNPTIITQMLMALLKAKNGARVCLLLLRKRVRDDVC